MNNGDSILIKDIKPGLKNINVTFIVLDIGSVSVTKENREVRNFKVGDPTACINVSIWDEPGKLIAPGDIVKLTKGYASIWRHCLTLYSGKNGGVYKVGEFCMTFNEQLNMSEPRRVEQAPTQGVSINTQNLPAGTSGTTTVTTTIQAQQLATAAGSSNSGNNNANHRGLPASGVAVTKASNTQAPIGGASKLGTLSTLATNVAAAQAPAVVSSGAPPISALPAKGIRGGRTNPTRAGNLKSERR